MRVIKIIVFILVVSLFVGCDIVGEDEMANVTISIIVPENENEDGTAYIIEEEYSKTNKKSYLFQSDYNNFIELLGNEIDIDDITIKEVMSIMFIEIPANITYTYENYYTDYMFTWEDVRIFQNVNCQLTIRIVDGLLDVENSTYITY